MSPVAETLVARLMSGLDLLIDFATLGEYGLDELHADGPGCERIGRTRVAPLTRRGGAPTGWEALTPARRSSSDRGRVPLGRHPRRAAAGSLR